MSEARKKQTGVVAGALDKLMRQNGLTCLPGGLSPNVSSRSLRLAHARGRSYRRRSIPGNPYTFLTVGTNYRMKEIALLMEAFVEGWHEQDQDLRSGAHA